LRLPAGQTENRDDSGRESGRFQPFRLIATRSTGGRNPAWRGDFRQEKGPGAYPSPVCGGAGVNRKTDRKAHRCLLSAIVVLEVAPKVAPRRAPLASNFPHLLAPDRWPVVPFGLSREFDFAQ